MGDLGYPSINCRVFTHPMLALETLAAPWSTRRMGPGSAFAEPVRLDPRKIGDALRKLREAAGLTQEEAALKIGSTQQTWQRYESGRSAALLRFDRLSMIANAVSSTASAIMTLADAPGDAMILFAPTSATRRNLDLAVWEQNAVSAMPGEPLRAIRVDDVFGLGLRAFELGGESMVPWAEPGDIIIYDTRRQ
ncbi:MAG: helix-turn-helix domain-containing protein, partial [Caulobacteraceae bacterium]